MSLGRRKRSKRVLKNWAKHYDVSASVGKRKRKARKSFKHAQTRRDRRDTKRMEEL